MSTRKVGTIQNTNGGSSSTPEQILSGRAKAWVNFNGNFGTSPFTEDNGGIRSAFNVSSVTDNGTGDYTVTFASAMSSVNYCPIAWAMRGTSSDSNYLVWQRTAPNVNSINIRSAFNWSSGGTATNLSYIYVVVFEN